MLLKIVVTDSAGAEHIFLEDAGEVENFLDFNPTEASDKPIKNAVRITTRVFTETETFASETISTFISPRCVDVFYGAYDEEE